MCEIWDIYITLDLRRENLNRALDPFGFCRQALDNDNMSSRQIIRSDFHVTNSSTGMWVPSLPP